MESVKMFLRLGLCTVFLISLVYSLPACGKKETPEQAQETTEEMAESSETRAPQRAPACAFLCRRV